MEHWSHRKRRSIAPYPEISHRSGFTFLEVMLVVFIIALSSALAIPTFMRSYRGAKLKASTRTVIMSHRYARSVAVLQQKQVAVMYDTVNGAIQIVVITPEGGSGPTGPIDMPAIGQGGHGGPEEEVSYSVKTELSRSLESGVHMTDFDMEKKGQEEDGIYWVNYYPNGMSDTFSMELEDKDGISVNLEADRISGKVRVEE